MIMITPCLLYAKANLVKNDFQSENFHLYIKVCQTAFWALELSMY